MKTTGSLRVEIDSEDKGYYDILVNATYSGRLDESPSRIVLIVPKSAVTDIRDEVDWSKVKKGAFVIVWDDDPEDYRPALWYGMSPAGKYFTSVSSIALESNEVDDWENCMLLTDWLKKEGGE